MTAAILSTLLAGLAAVIAVALAPRPPRSPDRGRRRREAGAELAPLARIERRVSTAADSALDAHVRLRPLLQKLAAERLARRGIRLENQDTARPLLGDELWELIRPDRPRPDDRTLPGPDTATVEDFVTRLENL